MAYGCSSPTTNGHYPTQSPFLRRSISANSAPPETGRKRNLYGFEKLITDQQQLKQQLLEKEHENEMFYAIIQKLNKDIAKSQIKFDYQQDQNKRLEKELRHLRRTFVPSQNSTEIDDLKQQLKEWKNHAACSSEAWQAEVNKLQREITRLTKRILDLLQEINRMQIKNLNDQMKRIISAPAQDRQNVVHFPEGSQARRRVLSLQ